MVRIRKQESNDAALKDEEIMAAAKISDALAHPVRIRMLRYILTENLARRTVTNKDLVQAFDYAQATISQHVSKLLIGGLLEMQKKGTSSCYFAHVGRLSIYTETLKKIESQGDGGEIPEFLRAEFFEPNPVEDSFREELHPEDFGEPEEEDIEAPHYL